MDWLTVGATLDDHRYTLSRGLTLLAAGGALVSVVAAVVVMRRRRPEDAPRGCLTPVLAVCALPASWIAAVGGSSTASIAGLFPETYHFDLAALTIAGLAAIAVALRMRSMASLALVLPGWLLAQCGLAHARSMHEPLPRITTKEIQKVQVGKTAEPKWGVSEPGYYGVDEVPLAPRERGEHAYVARARGDGKSIRVERTLRYQAIEERGDPLFPLRAGNRWLLRSEDGRAEMTIAVDSSQVENGIRWYEVTVRATAPNALTTDGPRRVYEADGRILEHDGEPFLMGLAPLPGGQRYYYALNADVACEGTETTAPPARLLAGPVWCVWRYTTIRAAGDRTLAGLAKLLMMSEADRSARTEIHALNLTLVRSETRQEGATK